MVFTDGGSDREHNKGPMLASITFEEAAAAAVDPSRIADPNVRNLVAEVSREKPRIFGQGNPVKARACGTGAWGKISSVGCAADPCC